MTKSFIIALALAAVSAPSFAAESIRIDTTGKSDAAIRSEVALAARKVCAEAHASSSLAAYLVASCYRATLKTAEASLSVRTAKATPERIASAQ